MQLVKTTHSHLLEAAHTVSAGDLEEFNAMKPGRNIEVVLLSSLFESSRTILTDEGKVLAVGGSTSCLWFITTTAVNDLNVRQRVEFFRILKGHLECVRKFTPPEHLTNYVYSRNWDHRRLLELLGATFENDYVMSPGGHPFIKFQF